MAEISAALVKELRERTGAGMMDCKRALTESGGDIDAAIEALRKAGIAGAAKKAGRIAAEGVIVFAGDAAHALLAEVNCETDFVAKDANFQTFAEAVARTALERRAASLEALMAAPLTGGSASVEETRQQLVAKLGENISVRRFERLEAGEGARLGSYVHGGRIGVLVELAAGDEDLARDLAMHVAASRPACVAESDVPAELLEQERQIFSAQAAQSGKPPAIIEKMVQGRIAKFVKEVTLLGQPFVRNPEETVAQLLEQHGARVTRFVRMEVGEGIEKKADNFAEEVMAQARRG